MGELDEILEVEKEFKVLNLKPELAVKRLISVMKSLAFRIEKLEVDKK